MLGFEELELRLNKAEAEVLHHKEDYGALAKRINDLEEEVFDCSDDDIEFDDDDEEMD